MQLWAKALQSYNDAAATLTEEELNAQFKFQIAAALAETAGSIGLRGILDEGGGAAGMSNRTMEGLL